MNDFIDWRGHPSACDDEWLSAAALKVDSEIRFRLPLRAIILQLHQP
jgi:hypothetical protein